LTGKQSIKVRSCLFSWLWARKAERARSIVSFCNGKFLAP